ncbi:MAG TPA: hypothetical protein VMA77_06000 [Solirubrobacteraceae bacterium]|nr:hypothetical protein [Solirubrobacteraceae bacterium]
MPANPTPPTPVDPLYVQARRVLLDALTTLAPHGVSVIVAGAQAIYLHTGEAEIAVAPYTSDGDLALDPSKLADSPTLEAAMLAAHFTLSAEPGIWLAAANLAGEAITIPVDLIVPEGAATGAGRRDARLPGHGRRVARRVLGLEAALVDHAPIAITALDPEDKRSVTAEVAGPTALLIAKLHKLHERIQGNRPHRLDDKDAADIVRIMQTTNPDEIADTWGTLAHHQIAGEPSLAALDHLDALYGRRGRRGIEMATRALRTGIPESRLQALCVGYTTALLARTAGLQRRPS